MNLGSFVLKNATRNKRRALLTVGGVATSLFLLVSLLIALRELTHPVEGAGASLRIAVRHKVSLGEWLPARQRAVIERLEGVAAVTPLTWFGGKFRGESTLAVQQMALDPAVFRLLFEEGRIDEAGLQSWIADRGSCIVGIDTARRFGIRPGDRVRIEGEILPVDLDLRVAAIYEGSIDDRNIFFHQRHLDELMDDPGLVGMWWVRARSAGDVPTVIERINATFANTSSEVLAETERAFQLWFLNMWGNIRVLIAAIGSVVVFALTLATLSTMSMAVRERMREMAVLKALGFRRRELFALILAESSLLSLAGAVIGIGGAWLLYARADVGSLTGGLFPAFEMTPRIIGQACLVASLLGILSAAAPAWAVARTTVVQGLRTLD